MKIYLFCTTMRTGSSLLCSYLADMKLAGNPLDYSNKFYLRQFGITEPGCQPLTPEYVQQMIDKYTVNDIFGMKLPYAAVRKEIQSDALECLFPDKPLYIYVTRHDKLKQAISASRGMQTHRWYSNQIDFGMKLPPIQERYNRSEIDMFLRQFDEQETEWESYFERNQINLLTITYEALTANPKRVIKQVLSFIGVKIPKSFELPPTRLEKQADGLSDEWEQKYKVGE
jgi:trehalose 2-sulfotransferase